MENDGRPFKEEAPQRTPELVRCSPELVRCSPFSTSQSQDGGLPAAGAEVGGADLRPQGSRARALLEAASSPLPPHAAAQAHTPYTPFPAGTAGASPNASPTPGQQRRGCYTDVTFSRVPSLFESRGGGQASVSQRPPATGSHTLQTAASPGAPSPATARKRQLHRTFRLAKRAADAELDAFLTDVRAAARAAGLAGADAEPLLALAALAEFCLGQGEEAFRGAVRGVVDRAEELRQGCSVRAHRAKATRLLFILTRCSRLVASEEASPGAPGGPLGPLGGAAMTAQPRFRQAGAGSRLRRFGGFPVLRGQGSADVGSEAAQLGRAAEGQAGGASVPLLMRSATAPTRTLREAAQADAAQAQQAQQQQYPQTTARWQGRPALSPMPESPAGSTSPGGGSSADTPSLRSVGPSPLGRSVVTALEAEMEQAARRASEGGEEGPSAGKVSVRQASASPGAEAEGQPGATPARGQAGPLEGRPGFLSGLKQRLGRWRTASRSRSRSPSLSLPGGGGGLVTPGSAVGSLRLDSRSPASEGGAHSPAHVSAQVGFQCR